MARTPIPSDKQIDEATPVQLMTWRKEIPMSADPDEKRRYMRISERINKLSTLERAKATKEAWA